MSTSLLSVSLLWDLITTNRLTSAALPILLAADRLCSVNSQDIANALSIDVRTVQRHLRSLKDNGIFDAINFNPATVMSPNHRSYILNLTDLTSTNDDSDESDAISEPVSARVESEPNRSVVEAAKYAAEILGVNSARVMFAFNNLARDRELPLPAVKEALKTAFEERLKREKLRQPRIYNLFGYMCGVLKNWYDDGLIKFWIKEKDIESEEDMNVIVDPMAKDEWNESLENIKNCVSDREFETWLATLMPGGYTVDGKLVLYAPNDFNRQWVGEKYSSIIESVLCRPFILGELGLKLAS
ncbi:MAG: DnaA N-terminal domain-containing protein [Bacillota bacterium]